MESELVDLSLEAAIQLGKRARTEPYSRNEIQALSRKLDEWTPRRVEGGDFRLRNLRHVRLFADAMRDVQTIDELIIRLDDIIDALRTEDISPSKAQELRDFCLDLNAALIASIQEKLDRKRWYANINAS